MLRPRHIRYRLALGAVLLGVCTLHGAAWSANPALARPSMDNSKLFWFAQVPDIRIGHVGQQDDNHHRDLTRDLARYVRPAFVIATGNQTSCTNGGLIVNGPWRLEWDGYRTHIENNGFDASTWYDVPGTRDQYNDGGLANYRAFSVQGEASNGETYHSWVYEAPYGRYHFLAMDTSPKDGLGWPFDNNGLTSSDINWARNELRSNQNSRLSFAFGFHPLADLRTGGSDFAGLLRQYKVSLYASSVAGDGNNPRYEARVENGVFQVRAGSLSRSTDDHFVLYAVDNDGLSFTRAKVNDFPWVLVTSPLDRGLAGGHPNSYTLARNSTNAVRVLVFDPIQDAPATVQVNSRPAQPLSLADASHPAYPMLRVGTISTQGLADGEHTLTVEVRGTSTRRVSLKFLVGATACSDGVDNDNDGRTDWPDDPGCENASDPDEADPTPTPTNTPTPTPTNTGTITPTPPPPTATPSANFLTPRSPTPTRTPDWTPSPTSTPTGTPFPPQIALAGYLQTRVTSRQGGQVTLVAFMLPGNGREVRLGPNPDGPPVLLRDDGANGDFTAGDGIYGVRANLGPPGSPLRILLELRPYDRFIEGRAWPYLTVDP